MNDARAGFGHVTSVAGGRAIFAFSDRPAEHRATPSNEATGTDSPVDRGSAEVDLLSEILENGGATAFLERGVSLMPALGADVLPTTREDPGDAAFAEAWPQETVKPVFVLDAAVVGKDKSIKFQ